MSSRWFYAGPGEERAMSEWATRQRSRLVGVGGAFAALAVLLGIGAAVVAFDQDKPGSTQQPVTGLATHTAPASEFNPAEKQIVGLLPPGYAAGSCARATDPFPNAVASLDCSENTNSDTPTYARFTLYQDLAALTGDFQLTAEGMVLSPCPGGSVSPAPGTWTSGQNTDQTTGRVVCGSVEDRANIAWTRDAQLLLATVNGGPDLNTLYQWWQRFGTRTQH
jgi:hypothetical protein